MFEINDIYDFFALTIAIVGILGGSYMLYRAFANRRRLLRCVILTLMGLTKWGVAAVYIAVLFGLPSVQTTVVSSGVYLRPMLSLLLGLPVLLVMGARI